MTISDSLGANRKTVATENQGTLGEKTEKTLSKKVLGKKEKKRSKDKKWYLSNFMNTAGKRVKGRWRPLRIHTLCPQLQTQASC